MFFTVTQVQNFSCFWLFILVLSLLIFVLIFSCSYLTVNSLYVSKTDNVLFDHSKKKFKKNDIQTTHFQWQRSDVSNSWLILSLTIKIGMRFCCSIYSQACMFSVALGIVLAKNDSFSCSPLV